MIGEIDGEYRHDSRRNLLEWCLPVIDAKNKSGSLEFSVAGQPNDFFPVQVSFISKKNYCNIQVRSLPALCRPDVRLASFELPRSSAGSRTGRAVARGPCCPA